MARGKAATKVVTHKNQYIYLFFLHFTVLRAWIILGSSIILSHHQGNEKGGEIYSL